MGDALGECGEVVLFELVGTGIEIIGLQRYRFGGGCRDDGDW